MTTGARHPPGDAMIGQLIEAMVELRFQSFLMDLPDPMVGVDRRGIVRFVNAQAERLFGRPKGDLLGLPADVLLVDPAGISQPSDWHAAPTNPRLRSSAPLELSALRPDGSKVPAEVTLSLVGTDTDDAEGLWVIAAIRDITDRKAAEEAMAAKEEAIRAARDAALQTSRLKSQFLANMSHEIRTPMNGVLGLAHLLAETELDPLQRRYVSSLRESGQNLLEIINDILDFSRVEAGKLKLETVEFEPRAIAESVVALLSSSAEQKGLRLGLDIDPATPWRLRGDPVRVRQVLTNLAGNAVKFTDAGGVMVRLGPGSAGRVRFEVSDTGIGIPPEARAYLLDPFTQADASTTRRFGGSGLGLAISHQLVNLMEGVLDFSSQPGRGSTFWFELPLAEAGPAVLLDPLRLRDAPGTPQGDQRKQVLVVDDSEINRVVATDLLEQLGYAVLAVGSGADAITAVARNAFDVILMDCLMPLMDGFEATASIRRLGGEAGRTPIVAITASAMAGDRERCLAAGMDDYVSKPIDPDTLADVVGRYAGVCCPAD